ncbi:alpha/beta fold hydrolase [Streptomyces sp. NBC_01410]|uniref:thioesterase II family protein n=1 Tax=Streptomyces sp. NBC_01410 TaxID=2903856 RepID=UPI0032524FCA
MTSWLRLRGATTGIAERRLVCFPHAGGTASSFASWPAQLPPGVETVAVQYPGRQDRLSEAYVEDMHEMADQLAAELRPLLDLPMTLFGHSMGTGLAYEVAKRLERDDDFVMERIFVSARPAPHRIDGEHRHRLSDEELIAAMRRLGGPDAEVYDYPQLLPLILPPLRSDLRLLDEYRPNSLTRLRAPFTAFGGERDDTCPLSELAFWEEATVAGSDVRIFEGGHHYLRDQEPAVVEAVSKELISPR